jgi:hypothetical protein
MRRQKEVNTSVLGSRARWFESVPERTNAKDPAPLKVKELWVKERRYIVCLNEEERRKRRALKGATARAATKAWSAIKATGAISKWKEAATLSSMKNKSKPKSATTASGCYGLTPSIMPRQWLTSIRHCGRSRTFSARLNRSLKLVPSITSAMRLFEVMCFAAGASEDSKPEILKVFATVIGPSSNHSEVFRNGTCIGGHGRAGCWSSKLEATGVQNSFLNANVRRTLF